MKVFLNSLGLFYLLIFVQCSTENKIDLTGEWKVRLDEENIGESNFWYNQTFEKKLILPGSLRDNDLGEIPSLETKWTGSIYDSSWFFNPDFEKYRKKDSLKFPFWLTPEKRFVGSAWYQKEIKIPESWNGESLVLHLERPHWKTKVWIDSLPVGSQNSLSTPHTYIIPPGQVSPGKHRLTILVNNDNKDIDPGINSHSITDHTQGNWNGITGKMSLESKKSVFIKNIRLTPDLEKRNIAVDILFHNLKGDKEHIIVIDIEGVNQNQEILSKEITLNSKSNSYKTDLPMGNNFKTWSEFAPNLYKITLNLKNLEGKPLDTYSETFGMRNFTINDKKFEINGIPIFLRGTTECCVFPLTGYPPTDEKEWIRVLSICKSFGLNHMRFHSYCPPEAAFSAADKVGIYLQVEGPSWAKYSVSLGNGKPIDQYLMDETKRIIDTYGNHPSFCMMAYGNEPSGRYVGYLEKWVDHFRRYDPQRVFTGASTGRSWKIIENSDFIVRSPPRGLKWSKRQPESVFDYRNKTENQNRPYVTFEMGQWCVFPNFNEIKKYTGPLKARNFEVFQEELINNHMGDQSNDFLMASGKLQALCYKSEIEATLRTPNLAGFQLLSLNDFPGQGTALVGVLDAFWDEKGYISAKEFSTFCNLVVPLARFHKFTFLNSDTLKPELEIANYSGESIVNVKPQWKIRDIENNIVRSGLLESQNIPVGQSSPVGGINVPLSFAGNAGKYNLEITVGEYSNNWNFWIYPDSETTPDPQYIYVCNSLDDKAKETMEKGGKVLLLAGGKVENGKDIVQYFTPVFWNTSWFRMRPPHTTGLLIQNEHPVFHNFPTDYYSDMQWWELINKSQAMNLANFPAEFSPIVQPIDTWFLNRRLGSLFEAKTNGGKLIVCSLNLNQKEENRIASKQLYSSILKYMLSEDFNPEKEIDLDIIEELFEQKERKTWNSYVKTNP
jgi:hypothetical protein